MIQNHSLITTFVLGTMLLGLAACQQDVAGSAPVTSVAQANASGGVAGTRFDGTYQGRFQLTRDSGQCGAANFQRDFTITNGRATTLYNIPQGLSASGAVTDDGSFALSGGAGNNISRINGRIEGDRGTATFESRFCSYSIDLVRRS